VAAPNVLVVEDRASLRKMLRHALTGEGYAVTAVGDVEGATRALAAESFDLVLTDLKLPIGSGMDVVVESRRVQPATPVVVLTAFGSVRTAVEAMKLGASDFLEKPVEVGDLLALVEAMVAGKGDDGFVGPAGTRIIGSHPELRAALRLLQRVAPTESTVLLTGESGTGKELFARALHELSPRASGPFVAVNCAAIPETLIENELFGHEKGSFTGAHRRELGRFEAAAGGTLFLDEIGDLGAALQSKVLRVLEERTFERVGGRETVRADVRLVAATNRDLNRMVDGGEFRSDLFFRLEVFPIELPPLRRRREDVEPLTRHLLAQLAARHGRRTPLLEPAAVEWLADQPWPGNVRQLANVLERALILGDAPTLSRADVEGLLGRVEAVDDERRRVEDALRRADGDKRKAAALLGLSYRTLQRRIRDYDLGGFPRYRGEGS
jgi:two-component system, NtrC family, response regulator AtoC